MGYEKEAVVMCTKTAMCMCCCVSSSNHLCVHRVIAVMMGSGCAAAAKGKGNSPK